GVGNLYIADGINNRVRKVSPAGIITTVAGNGQYDFAGDGGPAISASLRTPQGLALDPGGNLFVVDVNNHRVRKVSVAGTITTVAGNGQPAFSGDGAPAINASIQSAAGVAVDAAGNLYIADRGNNRVRKVTPDGIIQTIAGNGTPVGGVDGSPATSVSVNGPYGVAVDAAGSVYIGVITGARVRKVAPNGIITTVAGQGIAGFSGDGGPATAAQLDSPSGMAVDNSGNLYIADSLNDRIRKALAGPPSFAVAPANLSFSARAGAGGPAPQRMTITGSVIGIAWSAQVAAESSGNWLAVSPASGTMPSVVDVRVDVTNLAPGTYQGTVTIEAPLASPPMQTVAVRLTVEAALPPKLAVEPSSLSFETLAGGEAPAKTLRISNAGGGNFNWTARAETTSGGNWLSVSPASGSVSAGTSAQVRVAAGSTALAAGVYSGTVVVESATTNETLRVPVSLLIAQSRQNLLLSQGGLLFTGVEGGSLIPPQTFGVLNVGEGVMSWTAQASTLTGGNWLTVSPREGASDAASLRVPLVEVGVNVTGLRAGAYSGQIRMVAAGASNSPQFVTVILNVLPPGSNPGVLVRPTGLIFAAEAGTSSPGSQTVHLGTVTPGIVDVVSGLLTRDGGSWLEAAPRNLTLSAGEANRRIVV
ncbi:MAG: BACON domain-containing protein, partial [Gammaproteobacteria bacterium]